METSFIPTYVYTCMCVFRVTLAFKFHTEYNTKGTMGYNICLAYDMTLIVSYKSH